ncbi:hypothetical protein ACFYM0_11210 [Streptomyces sp. NPDC006487]|uniref:hypothetical protein n=1 Tax=Streptomyces sp. NPDC006487 TaxID=3364748 RepID=UPI003691A373
MRLEPTGPGSWLLSREDRLHGHRVSAVAAAALVSAFTKTGRTELTSTISTWTSSKGSAEKIIDWLIFEGYLVDCSDSEAAETADWLDQWNANGWRAAARYHARTFGYPFEFYASDGSSAEDFRRMVAYNQRQPDTDRARGRIVDAAVSHPLPDPAAELNEARFGTVVAGASPGRKLNRDAVLDLLSLLARPIRADDMPYARAAPLLRKTSPSGGSRHPTELTLLTSGLPDVLDGVYQVASVDGVLDSVDSVWTPPADWLGLLGLAATTGPWALVLYSSFFARNRYRYREPRTFRTVHMDVGHLMTTCEFLGRANGWRVRQVQHLNGPEVAAHLGVDPYVECPMSATLLTSLERPN